MNTVYRLKDDQKNIADIQRATKTTDEFGIEPTHGLFGSDEWWRNIATGQLVLQTLKGVISSVYMSGHNDWPEFEMVDENDNKSSWTRVANSQELDNSYLAVHSIELDFVVQRHRTKSWDRGAETKCVVEVRISDA